jgi:hypothetical protein
VKNQFVLKLTLTLALLALMFGCAVPIKNTPPKDHAVVAIPPAALLPMINQEVALDKNEVIIDKPAPVQTEVLSLLAKITPTQQTRIAQALKDGSAEIKTLVSVNQATPKMRAFVERLSCIRQYNDGGSAVLQGMAAPGVSFKFFVPPMHGTKAHNRNSCLTVSSVALKVANTKGGDALQIKVSYLADDSGETTTSNHEINKNSKGVWWFTR